MPESAPITGEVTTRNGGGRRWDEERYRTLFDLGPVAVFSCDVAGVIREFNRRAAELWGGEPTVADAGKRFCGSTKLFRPDGTYLAHEQCPMAQVVAGTLAEVRDEELAPRADRRLADYRAHEHPALQERSAARSPEPSIASTTSRRVSRLRRSCARAWKR